MIQPESKKVLRGSAYSSVSFSGFTLVEVLVGTFLMLIVFVGIFTAYRLELKVVGLSKNKITAIALANGWIEKIRNLSYQDVGTVGASPSPPYAQGILESSTTTEMNGVRYEVNIVVKYIADTSDGLAYPDDECPNDYKKAEVTVSWPGQSKGEAKFSTIIAPENLSQECKTSGGILSVTVFDAYGTAVSSTLIDVEDPQGNLIDSATPADGKHNFPLATSTYKVVVSKDGYSSEETFGVGDIYNGKVITTPEKPNLPVLEDQVTESSFSIDKLSSFTVDTLSPRGQDFWSDSFNDSSKVSENSTTTIGGGEVALATTSDGYLPSGYLVSTSITPATLVQWDELSFDDSKSFGTDLKYQLYYASGTEWYIIPDSDLPGNSNGFDVSPVDLSNLSTSTYSQLKIKGNLSTDSTSTSPTLYDWQVSWITSTPTPISDVTFLLQGTKKVGSDSDENPIYKYSATSTSDSSGHVDISNLEWDNYTFSVATDTNLDLIGTDPSSQPIGLDPDTTLPVKLYLDSQNSLLLTVEDAETLNPIFSASTTLSNTSLNYNKTQYTDEKGQAYFIPLDNGIYNLDVSAEGYLATSTSVSISGDETKVIKLTPSD